MRFCLYYDFSALSGKTFGFHKQNSIFGGLRRKLEVRGSLGHKKQGNARKRAKHGRAPGPHGRAPRTRHDQPARQLARAGRATWHGRATWWPAAVKPILRFCFRGSFPFRFSSLFFLLLLGFGESGF